MAESVGSDSLLYNADEDIENNEEFLAYLIVPPVSYFRNIQTTARGKIREDSFLRIASTKTESEEIRAELLTAYGVRTRSIPLGIRITGDSNVSISVKRIPDLGARYRDPTVGEIFQYLGNTVDVGGETVPLYDLSTQSTQYITESPNNLYYTDQRVTDHIATPPINVTPSGLEVQTYLNTITPPEGDNSLRLATTEYTDRAIASLIGGAPEFLDTLDELAAAIEDDELFYDTMFRRNEEIRQEQTRTQEGSGLLTDSNPLVIASIESGSGAYNSGDYKTEETSNYLKAQDFIDSSLSANLFNADILLDSAVNNLQIELDNTQTGAGLESDGSYTSYTQYNDVTATDGAHYIHSASDLRESDKLLDTRVYSVTLGSGLDSQGNYVQKTDAKFIGGATSLQDADEKLDAALDNQVTSVLSTLRTERASAIATAEQTLNATIDIERDRITVESGKLTNLTSAVAIQATDENGNPLTDADGNPLYINANADAIDSLTTRVTDNEGDITAESRKLTNLTSAVAIPTGSVDANGAPLYINANADAIESLTTRVTTAEGTITSESAKLTNLTSAVATPSLDANGNPLTDANGNPLYINANADAIESLTTRVTTAEGTITSESKKLIGLTNAVAIPTGTVDANGNPVYTNANSSAISGLTSSVQSIEGVGEPGDPDYVQGSIRALSEDITTLGNSIDGAISTATSSLSSTVEFLKGSGLPYLDADGNPTATDTGTPNPNYVPDQITSLSQDITDLGASIDGAVSTATQSLTTTVDQIGEDLEATSDAVTALEGVLVDEEGNPLATASALQNLITSVSSDGSASAVYALNLNANNHVAGIRFENTSAGGVSTADFVIKTDTFKIVNATDVGVTPFSVVGDRVELTNVTVTGGLDVGGSSGGRMNLDDDKIQIFDTNSNLRVKIGKLT